MVTRRTSIASVDWILIAVIVALLIFGLLALYSVTLSSYISDAFFTLQLRWLAIGLVVALLMYFIPYPIWQKLAIVMMVLSLFALLVTVVFSKPSPDISGAPRELSEDARHLGSLLGLGNSVQPGVLARLVAVIYIAAWLSSKGEQLNRVTYGLLPFGVIVGLVGGLVVLQPDLSTALLIVVTGVAMFFFAGGDPIQIFASIVISGLTFGLLAWNLDYARGRLEAYIASLSDPSLMPYHVHRAVQAISEGGLFGVGLGAGRMKFGYLPVPHTDSIFAVIAEETGLLGCLVVIGLFIVLAQRGYRITLGTPDSFGSLVAFGVTTMIVSEVLLNIAVMVGIFPPTGTALPFFSYGGTEMLITMAGMGLVLSVSRGRPKGDWDATLDRWWRDGWARISGARRRSSLARHRF
ncbi:MAG: FtsW/RodA/SpoVE family cell cycle protein [Anaerolineae bacterium]